MAADDPAGAVHGMLHAVKSGLATRARGVEPL